MIVHLEISVKCQWYATVSLHFRLKSLVHLKAQIGQKKSQVAQVRVSGRFPQLWLRKWSIWACCRFRWHGLSLRWRNSSVVTSRKDSFGRLWPEERKGWARGLHLEGSSHWSRKVPYHTEQIVFLMALHSGDPCHFFWGLAWLLTGSSGYVRQCILVKRLCPSLPSICKL